MQDNLVLGGQFEFRFKHDGNAKQTQVKYFTQLRVYDIMKFKLII